MEIKINIKNCINPMIKCYAINSCKSIIIIGDTIDIKLFFYNFNKNVIIYLPSKYNIGKFILYVIQMMHIYY